MPWSSRIRQRQETILKRNFRIILDHSFGGGVTAFSRAARMHHNSIAELVLGTARPGLDSLLRLAAAARIKAVKLVGGAISANDLPSTAGPADLNQFERRVCRKYDWPGIAKLLRRELNHSHESPRSLFSLCRPRDLDSGYVALQLNKSAKALIRRHKEAASAGRQKREFAEKHDVLQKVEFCLKNRIWPSNRKLRLILKVPGSLRNPKLEKERRRAVAADFESRTR